MLNYASYGDPKSPSMLMLHGFMGSARDWDSVAGALSQDFFCIAPDLPGHGCSTKLPDDSYTMEGSAQAVVSLMDELDVEKAKLVGYSMGGRLALYLALRHPERCAVLFLESASPGIESQEERETRRRADEEKARRLERGDFEEFLRDWYRQPLFVSLAGRKELLKQTIKRRLSNEPAELAKSLRGMGTGSQASLWGELPALGVPALAVAGELDEKFVRISYRMAGSSPNMRAVVVSGAGHNVGFEAPETYFELLESYLTFAAG